MKSFSEHITGYIAVDGTRFTGDTSRDDCAEYERDLKQSVMIEVMTHTRIVIDPTNKIIYAKPLDPTGLITLYKYFTYFTDGLYDADEVTSHLALIGHWCKFVYDGECCEYYLVGTIDELVKELADTQAVLNNVDVAVSTMSPIIRGKSIYNYTDFKEVKQ